MNLFTDVETTGLAPKNAEYKTQFHLFPDIVSIGWKVDEEPTKDFIINQEGREIPLQASNLHGITTEIANASPHFIKPVMEEFIDLNVPEKCIGHNIYFDSSTIKAQVLRLVAKSKLTKAMYEKLEEILHKDRRVDTMKLTTKYCDLPGKFGPKWPKLEELHFKLFGTLPEKSHSSGSDVDTTHKCYVELVRIGIIK